MPMRTRRSIEEKEAAIREVVELGCTPLALRRAATKLDCDMKTVRRYLAKYRQDPATAFVHGNKGRTPAITIGQDVRTQVVGLYKASYMGANFTHYLEIVAEDIGVTVSTTTFAKWAGEEGIISPKAWRKTRKALAAAVRQALREGAPAGDVPLPALDPHLVDALDAHPSRPRCKYFGELIQMDASSMRWNGTSVWHLHLAVDDSTGEVVGAWFDNQETLDGYYHVLKQILEKYGIPAGFLTDKRTVFEYERADSRREDKDTFTQFQAACGTLGIVIQTSSVSQAKGAIERLNGVFQSRLPVELRRKKITGMEEANKYLVEVFLPDYNEKFSNLDKTALASQVFAPCPSAEVVNTTLAVIAKRTFSSGHCLRLNKQNYVTIDAEGRRKFFRKGVKALFIKAFDGSLFANVDDTIYALERIAEKALHSPEFDDVPQVIKERKPYIPADTRAWKYSRYDLSRKSTDTAKYREEQA
jgi:transposase-like protein